MMAMLAGVMCHRDLQTALARGLEGQQFFKWALAHYYRFGAHVPWSFVLSNFFLAAAGNMVGGIGLVTLNRFTQARSGGASQAGSA